MVEDVLTGGFKTTDKTIVVRDPVLKHDKPTNTDHIDPNTNEKWGIDPVTKEPFKDIVDKWPKDPVTGDFVNPVKVDVPELEDVKNPETGLPFNVDVVTKEPLPKEKEPEKKKPVVIELPEEIPDVVIVDVNVKPEDKPLPKPYIPPAKPIKPVVDINV